MPGAGGGIVLYGVESSYAADVLESMHRAGIGLAASVITGELEWDLEGVDSPFAGEVPESLRGSVCLVPYLTPGRRKVRVDRALEAGLVLAAPLVDPTAIVPRTLVIAEGAYINAGAVVGAQCRLGPCVMVGRNASIGHHSVLDEFSSVGPGATIASKVTVGRGAMVGAGASVAPDITIGANAVVASGTSVFRDVPDNVLVVGNPARIAKTGIAGFQGVGV